MNLAWLSFMRRAVPVDGACPRLIEVDDVAFSTVGPSGAVAGVSLDGGESQ